MNKILVVDDEAHNRELLKDFLEEKEYTVITAENGKEAIEKINEKPDLVLLDIQMPGMNGLQALEKIKEEEPSIGVVMVTSMAEQDIAMECIKKGAYDYVTKPIDFNHLESVIGVYMIQMSTEEEPVAKNERPKEDIPFEGEKEETDKKPETIDKPDMPKGIEKRKCRRFNIPGSSGKLKKTGLIVTLKGFSRAYPVIDISKGGLSFTCPEKLKVNQKILFQLLAPHEPVLTLRSIIRRVGQPDTKGNRTCGVQFMSYGRGSNENPIETLNVLRRLDEKYGGDMK